MTVIARRFASSPARTAGETWERIVALMSRAGSEARAELEVVAGIAASIIADETPRESPIIVTGEGPRLSAYCVYGEDAIVGDDCDESALTWTPAEGDWHLFLPCSAEEMDWVKRALEQRSRRVLAYDADRGIPDTGSEKPSAERGALSVNIEGFFRK